VEDSEVGGSNTGNGIPSSSTLESSVGTTCFDDVVSDGDIEESVGVSSGGLVNPRVQESQGRLSSVQTDIVQEGEDSGESGGRSGSSSDSGNTSVDDDLEVNITESSTIRGGSVGFVVRASSGESGVGGKVSADSARLVRGLRVIDEETSSRSESLDGSLRAGVSGQEASSSNGGDVRAGARVRGVQNSLADISFVSLAA